MLRRQTLQSMVDGLRYFSTIPHPLDLFLGKPQPLPFARTHTSPNCYITELVNVAFIMRREFRRVRHLIEFFDKLFFGLRVMVCLWPLLARSPTRQVFVPQLRCQKCRVFRWVSSEVVQSRLKYVFRQS